MVLPLKAGAEASISTKTYTNTLALLHLMRQALTGSTGIDKGLRTLDGAADSMAGADAAVVDRAVGLLKTARAIHFISRGPAMTSAKQAALTFMEGTRTLGSALTGGAFRHGPFELVDPSHHSVFFIPNGPTRDLLVSMAREVAEKGGHVVVIADTNVDIAAPNVVVLRVAEQGEDLFPLSAAVTHELLLNGLAVTKGLETGKFRYGQKITTTE